MKNFLILILVVVFYSNNFAQNNILTVPAIISDNMVLQQNSNTKIWGKAKIGSTVDVVPSWGKSSNSTTDSYGNWITDIQTPPAGGPYKINIKCGDEEINVNNVLIGEVWLCSGQSNMEMPLRGWPPNDLIENSEEAIVNSTNSKIRFFTVARTISVVPNKVCVGSWEESSPATSASFSATAYFFGKRLYDELKIPIGLIHSSWGGTPAEAWTSGKYLEVFPRYQESLKEISNGSKEINELKKWQDNLPKIELNKKNVETRWADLNFQDSECSNSNYNDSNWPNMSLPVLWETTELGSFDGAVWFRRKIEIPDNWINKDLILELGPIDDMDITYVNGEKIGGYEKEGFWQTNRIYNIPKDIVHNSMLSIAVRVVDNQGGGGIFGSIDQMNITLVGSNQKISISGEWKYLPVAEFDNMRFYIFGSANEKFKERPKLSFNYSSKTPTTLYNGMIAPLIPFNIKGAIWYQGESNVGEAEEYKKLFSTLIKNWRAAWGIGDFPFYYTQIAPWNYGQESHSELLREAQMKTMSVKNTGMIVTLDIGNPDNIHPSKKYEVGNRLALWALANNYGKDIVYSGPIYNSFNIVDDKVFISFNYADEGLSIKEINGANNFLIAGRDKVFKNAEVIIEGNSIVVFNPEIKNPVAVRYCWDNISEGTLFNKQGLPASSFRTDD